MYPVMLKLERKKIVIVGGGKVATKKTQTLLAEGANITVISPEITEQLESFVQNGEIQWLARNFAEDDVNDAFLVFAATNNPKINEFVKMSCSSNQLINVANDLKESSFFNTAVFEKGNLKIAISTEGTSPLLAKKIKSDLEKLFDDEYEQYLNFLHVAREKIKQIVKDESMKVNLLCEIIDDVYRYNKEEQERFLKLLDEDCSKKN